MFIEVPIVCNNPEMSALKELNIPIDGDMYDVRMGKINVLLLQAYYPDDKGKVICSVGGEEFSVDLPYNEFDKLICK
jgi:hypothetical protein